MAAAAPIHDSKGLTNPDVSAPGVTAPVRADSEYTITFDEEKGNDKNVAYVSTSASTSEEELLKQ